MSYDEHGNLIYKGWKIIKISLFLVEAQKDKKTFNARSYAEAKAIINNKTSYLGLKSIKEVKA